jgi:hypothetical protein
MRAAFTTAEFGLKTRTTGNLTGRVASLRRLGMSSRQGFSNRGVSRHARHSDGKGMLWGNSREPMSSPPGVKGGEGMAIKRQRKA